MPQLLRSTEVCYRLLTLCARDKTPQLAIIITLMTRGNQRDIDRERARKRNADKQGKTHNNGQPWEKTKDTHAEIMRQKQQAHEQKKGG